MKNKYRLQLLLMFLVLTCGGCGFGGFNQKSTATPGGGSSSGTAAKIYGVVSCGTFKQGKVEVYAVSGAGVETLVKTTSMAAFGSYSAAIGVPKEADGVSYNGVVVIKASGSYLDEATGRELSIPPESPLQAAVTNPSGAVSVMVTPLTELAVRKALQGSASLSTTNVAAANRLVSQLFKVDIVATAPVLPDQSASGFGDATTSQEQKDYTLALAAISWMGKDSALASTLATLTGSINFGSMSVEVAQAIRKALEDFMASEMNETGVRDINLTNLANIGGGVNKVKLSTAGTLEPGATINGVTLSLSLPLGVTVRSDYTLTDQISTLEGVVAASGMAATASYVEAKYLPASGAHPAMVTLSVANAGGFNLGEFVTLTCDLPPGASPQAGDFLVSDFKAKDGNGAPLLNVVIQLPVTLE